MVTYAQRLTRGLPIDDALYGELSRHFSPAALIELCFIIGSANMVNRFHATFRTDVERSTQTELAESCPIRLPAPPD